MEITKTECATVDQLHDLPAGLCELTELQLALVGGGIGEVVVG